MVSQRDKIMGKPVANDPNAPRPKVENPTAIFNDFDPIHLHPRQTSPDPKTSPTPPPNPRSSNAPAPGNETPPGPTAANASVAPPAPAPAASTLPIPKSPADQVPAGSPFTP
jgi:hypothetical protein